MKLQSKNKQNLTQGVWKNQSGLHSHSPIPDEAPAAVAARSQHLRLERHIKTNETAFKEIPERNTATKTNYIWRYKKQLGLSHKHTQRGTYHTQRGRYPTHTQRGRPHPERQIPDMQTHTKQTKETARRLSSCLDKHRQSTCGGHFLPTSYTCAARPTWQCRSAGEGLAIRFAVVGA